MSLYDRIIPPEALRWGALTRPWDPWADVGPWFVMPFTTGGFIPKGQPHPLTQADIPLIRHTDEPIDIAAVIAAGEGVDKTLRHIAAPRSGRYTASASVTIRQAAPRRPWLPWRKRR